MKDRDAPQIQWTPPPPRFLQRQRVSRGLRPVGEVFALKFKGVGYLFGRVIRNDCALEEAGHPNPWPRYPGLYLIYVYKPVSRRLEEIPELRRDRILIPPVMVGDDGWSNGYFLPVRRDALDETDVRPSHCFMCEDYSPDGRRIVVYVDEYGDEPERRLKPFCQVGDAGVVDRLIADALGITR